MMVGSEDERLSRLSTWWTLFARVRTGAESDPSPIWNQLLERYHRAAYRYLLGAVRDEDAASDLFQEFALRFLRGDFRRADPERGRFRDYLKRCLIHLVTDHRRRQARLPASLPEALAQPTVIAPDDDETFLRGWREELLARAWDSLAAESPFLHAVLLHRSRQPELPAAEAAKELGTQLGRTISANHLRVSLHRARDKLAELLREEVSQSLPDGTQEELRQELRDLGLAGICRLDT